MGKYSCELKGNKWMVENATKADGENGVITVKVEKPSQSVYIYMCTEATVVVEGKCNAISVDACKKSNVLCDTVVASVEVMNSQRMKFQIKDFAPTVVIDKTDGCLTYLSKKCIENPDFSISAAKSSEMNISFPQGPDDEYVEKALPEQFVYKLDLSGSEPKVTSAVSDLYSA